MHVEASHWVHKTNIFTMFVTIFWPWLMSRPQTLWDMVIALHKNILPSIKRSRQSLNALIVVVVVVVLELISKGTLQQSSVVRFFFIIFYFFMLGVCFCLSSE